MSIAPAFNDVTGGRHYKKAKVDPSHLLYYSGGKNYTMKREEDFKSTFN